MKREHHINFWYIIIAMFTILMLQSYFAQKGNIQKIPYSEFQQNLNEGKIDMIE